MSNLHCCSNFRYCSLFAPHLMDSSLPVSPVHLYNLALFNPLSPILALHAVHIDSLAYHQGLTLPDVAHCDECASIHIPGLTCSSRVIYLKKSLSSYRTRLLQVTCLVCGHRKCRTGLLDAKRVVESATRTEKKKKKKRSELASMLAAKRENNTKKPLSLFEFMQ